MADINFKQEVDYICYLKNSNRPFYVFGAGEVSSRIIDILQKNKLQAIAYIVDDQYITQASNLYQNVISTSQIETLGEIDVILGVRDYVEATHKLKKYKNIKEIIAFNRIFNTERISNDYYKANQKEFNQFEKWLCDDFSKITLKAYLMANIYNNPIYIYTTYDRGIQYFSCENVLFTDKELFVNCGAFNGDTILDFLRKVNFHYNKIFAIEADKYNYQRLLENLKDEDKIKFINKGAYNHNNGISFVPTTNTSISKGMSRIANLPIDKETFINTISTDTIDNILNGEPVSFINMDIEGSEICALKGAKKSIERWKPKLAISVYHKRNDLITIPKFIKEIDNNYRFYLREYVPWSEELILFATI